MPPAIETDESGYPINPWLVGGTAGLATAAVAYQQRENIKTGAQKAGSKIKSKASKLKFRNRPPATLDMTQEQLAEQLRNRKPVNQVDETEPYYADFEDADPLPQPAPSPFDEKVDVLDFNTEPLDTRPEDPAARIVNPPQGN